MSFSIAYFLCLAKTFNLFSRSRKKSVARKTDVSAGMPVFWSLRLQDGTARLHVRAFSTWT